MGDTIKCSSFVTRVRCQDPTVCKNAAENFYLVENVNYKRVLAYCKNHYDFFISFGNGKRITIEEYECLSVLLA